MRHYQSSSGGKIAGQTLHNYRVRWEWQSARLHKEAEATLARRYDLEALRTGSSMVTRRQALDRLTTSIIADTPRTEPHALAEDPP